MDDIERASIAALKQEQVIFLDVHPGDWPQRAGMSDSHYFVSLSCANCRQGVYVAVKKGVPMHPVIHTKVCPHCEVAGGLK